MSQPNPLTSLDIWSFAKTLYARPGVEAACLALQDAGLDVAVLLALVYAGHGGEGRLAPERIAHIAALADRWQTDVTRPLRTARRALKAPPAGFAGASVETLRQQIMALELDAEQLFLVRVEEFTGCSGTTPDRAAAQGNIEAYAVLLGRPLLAPETAAVETVLNAAF